MKQVQVVILKKKCFECGKEILKSPHYSYKQWNKKNFCSRACVAKNQQKGQMKDCERCLKSFYWRPSMKVGRYCSNSCAHTGNKNCQGKHWKVKNTSKMKKSEEHKRKISESQMGNKYRWIADRIKLKKSGDSERDRRSSAYVTWRKEVWLRDNFKCKIANPDCAGRIEAHHILGWTEYPELRYQLNNGITLCHAHHPRKRAEEKRLSPYFQELVSVSKIDFENN